MKCHILRKRFLYAYYIMVLLFKQLSGVNYSAIKGIISCRVDMKAILCCRTCSIRCIESESNEVIGYVLPKMWKLA